jgi:glycosyltransferase involved in cell wall biosynthesis
MMVNRMLFIYSELAIGGIQTFFVRMAKSRYLAGEKTRFLLTQDQAASDSGLLEEAKKYADVYFLEDIVSLPASISKRIPQSLLLMMPLKKEKIEALLGGIQHVHTANSIFGFFYLRMAELLKLEAKLSFGVYHAREYIWDLDGYTPFYQMTNKKLFAKKLKSQIFFNEGVLKHYQETTKMDLAQANLFPIGVIEALPAVSPLENKKRNGHFRIGSVGRLVGFKSYNLWMIDLIKILSDQGYDVMYVIYGKGPLEDEMRRKIQDLKIEDIVELRGNIPTEDIGIALDELDLFVGSGTSIVEASARGIPSIVGIESLRQPFSYGFFSEIPGFTYNEDGLYPKHSVLGSIIKLINLPNADLINLKVQHVLKARIFDMQTCADNFSRIDPEPFKIEELQEYTGFFFRLRYSITNFLIPRLYLWQGKDPAKLIYG